MCCQVPGQQLRSGMAPPLQGGLPAPQPPPTSAAATAAHLAASQAALLAQQQRQRAAVQQQQVLSYANWGMGCRRVTQACHRHVTESPLKAASLQQAAGVCNIDLCW